MTLDVRDVAYFGHFNMDILMRMENLQELDLLTQQGQRYNYSIDLIARLAGDFEDVRHSNPGWECPRVKILERDTKNELKVIAGGALIPGWKYGDDDTVPINNLQNHGF